jgi:ketosteroid isomerase-like protein
MMVRTGECERSREEERREAYDATTSNRRRCTVDARSNIEHIEQEYQAFCDGDFEAVGRLLHDEVVWHVAGDRATSGDKQGKDEVLRFLGETAAATRQNFRIQVHDVLANPEHVVVLCHVTSTREDETYRADEVHVFHVDGDGRVLEAWGFTADPAGQGAFWF